jgi:2-oxoglutarate ferredoxin oxidoreductase subunit gamma
MTNIENILRTQGRNSKDEKGMPQLAIRFCGFGGQGIVLSSIIVASGAIHHEGKSAVQTQSYGPESRGGASKSEVIISDNVIDYPLIEKADVLVALSQEGLEKYVRDTREGGLLIIDPVFIKEIPKIENIRVVEIPSVKIAGVIGSLLIANMVILGALIALTSVISTDSLRKAIEENTPPDSHQMNISGMLAGIEFARNINL